MSGNWTMIPPCPWCDGPTEPWTETPTWEVFRCPIDDAVVGHPKSGCAPPSRPGPWYGGWGEGNREIEQAYRYLVQIYTSLPQPRPPAGDPRDGELEEAINVACYRRDLPALRAALEAYVYAVIQRWAGAGREAVR